MTAQLQRVRLPTLTGAGGPGKSRLGLQIGWDLHDQAAYPDGVWFVDLGSLTNPDRLPAAVAAVFGQREKESAGLLAARLPPNGTRDRAGSGRGQCAPQRLGTGLRPREVVGDGGRDAVTLASAADRA